MILVLGLRARATVMAPHAPLPPPIAAYGTGDHGADDSRLLAGLLLGGLFMGLIAIDNTLRQDPLALPVGDEQHLDLARHG